MSGYLTKKHSLVTVHKRRSQSGGGGFCPVRTFCGQGKGDSSHAEFALF